MYREYLQRFYECLMRVEYTFGQAGDGAGEAPGIRGRGSERQNLGGQEQAFQDMVELFCSVRREGRQLFFIGNGGSAAIAGHMTADFMKNGRMRTVSLFAPAMLTCMGNDYGYESVFSKPLGLLGSKNDLLVTVSSSGNSDNIIEAAKAARDLGMKIITLSGFRPDNQSRSLGDINIYVPIEHYGIVESIHNLLLQQVVDILMEQEDKK